MRKTATWLCFVAALALCSGAAPAPEKQSDSAMAAQMRLAESGLSTFRQLVNEKNYQGMGFSSLEDVRRAQLGAPMRIILVRLDALKAMDASAPAESVFSDVERVLVPVKVDDKVVTGLYLTNGKDGWHAGEFGNPALARLTDAHRHATSDVIVWIPAAKIYFVGSGSGSAMTLTPLMDDPRFEFRAGASLSATAALQKVKVGMAGYNGLPQ